MCEDNDVKNNIDEITNMAGIKNKMTQISDFKENMKKQEEAMFGDIDINKELIEKELDKYTIDEVKSFNNNKVNEIFTIANILMKVNDNESEESLNLYKKDLLIYFKESIELFKSIDKEEQKLNEELNNFNRDLKTLMDKTGDMTLLLLDKIDSDILKSNDEDVINKLIKSKKVIIEALELKQLFSIYTDKRKSKNLMDDYLNVGRSEVIYKRYQQCAKTLNIKFDVTHIKDFEKKVLPEKYHITPNLFIFSVIRYMSYLKISAKKETDGMFFTTLISNVCKLYKKNEYTDRDSDLYDIIIKYLDMIYDNCEIK